MDDCKLFWRINAVNCYFQNFTQINYLPECKQYKSISHLHLNKLSTLSIYLDFWQLFVLFSVADKSQYQGWVSVEHIMFCVSGSSACVGFRVNSISRHGQFKWQRKWEANGADISVSHFKEKCSSGAKLVRLGNSSQSNAQWSQVTDSGIHSHTHLQGR